MSLHHRRDAVDGAQEVAGFVGEALRPRAAWPACVAAGVGEPVEVLAFVVIEQESAGDRVAYLGRCPSGLALFQPGVVRDADARQLRQFLAPEAGHSSAGPQVTQADVLDPTPSPAWLAGWLAAQVHGAWVAFARTGGPGRAPTTRSDPPWKSWAKR